MGSLRGRLTGFRLAREYFSQGMMGKADMGSIQTTPPQEAIDYKVDGSVTQSAEDLTFNQDDGGSSPSRPTINILVAKQCQYCKQPMHIHRIDKEVVFSGCEPCVVQIVLERTGEKDILVKGKRSTKTIRCQQCKRRHLIRSFDEVKNGVGL